ncbi:hypothetical protein [Clostridium sp. USBA 49]|uniref:hypothetical protein n=1 Tax=Clostridium sp. USBA 49 TaxID=1881060 RepID=UPI00099AECFE|nr:hypothetical protein [Clostridium sp. USBA 49]
MNKMEIVLFSNAISALVVSLVLKSNISEIGKLKTKIQNHHNISKKMLDIIINILLLIGFILLIIWILQLFIK